MVKTRMASTWAWDTSSDQHESGAWLLIDSFVLGKLRSG